ncbi:unnamed protein product [Spirodela intermedia]|uniref:Uncharacterized protein n=1 Tax=Spirodela intermedia TaxID=51605 RepID=A0A7I8JCI7_SPIIN|nr:unnamed protein product [Spirodela intermedia]CAA6667213.1 unnamed protein product [Spirodela intermedia]
MPIDLSGLAWTDRGMCAPLPFHVTGGQPAVGQGVVVHQLESLDHRRKSHQCDSRSIATKIAERFAIKGSRIHRVNHLD